MPSFVPLAMQEIQNLQGSVCQTKESKRIKFVFRFRPSHYNSVSEFNGDRFLKILYDKNPETITPVMELGTAI